MEMEHESEEEDEKVVKRKADTDARNPQFVKKLLLREEEGPKDMIVENMLHVHQMNTGRPLKPRIDVPEGFLVHPYGGQSLNIWEFQKEQLRTKIAKDPGNYYTYSKSYNSGAFPVVNELKQVVAEKRKASRGGRPPRASTN